MIKLYDVKVYYINRSDMDRQNNMDLIVICEHFGDLKESTFGFPHLGFGKYFI